MARPGPILVVDDEAEVRDVLQQALTQGGYDVVTAENAEAALTCFSAQDFPVVITDLYMPGLSGLELLAEIRARSPDTFGIVITGFASVEVAVESLKRGAYDFIQKPFKLGQIEATVSRALDHALTKARLEAYQHRLEELVIARTEELRDLHEEVLRLNTLLISVQGEAELPRRVQPFLAHLRDRWQPDEMALAIPEAGAWEVAAQGGPRTWEVEELRVRLDKADQHVIHLPAGFGALAEGYLVPLTNGDRRLGVVILGYRQRSAFHPQDKVFVLWCRQLAAALHGWTHYCAHTGG